VALRCRLERMSCGKLLVSAATNSGRLDPQFTSTSGPVAQLAEQQTLNLRVVGSIPTRLTSIPNRIDNFALTGSPLKP
jgi:hypothetical protein